MDTFSGSVHLPSRKSHGKTNHTYLPIEPGNIALVQVTMLRWDCSNHSIEVVEFKEPLVSRKKSKHVYSTVEELSLLCD